MAYVPPHRRVKASSSSYRRAQASSSSQTPILYYLPEADIDEGSAVFIWFAVDANVNPPPNLKLEFKPFADTSIPHMRDKKVYTISVHSHPVNDVKNDVRSLMTNETSPWRYTLKKIKDDLRKCFHKLEKYIEVSEPYYAKPSFTARFGKIIFHGHGLAWHESFTLETLEKTFSGQRGLQTPSKTFDTNIPKDIFEAVKEKAIISFASPTLKEKVAYLIWVRDVFNPDVAIMVTCRKKDMDGNQIVLKKIELVTLKHLLTDTSCLNKLMDWRLSVTEKYMVDLHEEDKECIEGIVKSACIDVSARGGLRWPPGVLKRNRFQVREVCILNVTTVVGKTWDIKFQHANKVHLEDSSACRVSNEIDLKLKSISKYLRERRQWEEENIMNILEDSLKWVWMEGLSII
ncbi:hypothetical protein SUGI_1084840 [Cryptomeria japonica]|uniref:uncharacterized protein LOC131076074 n=1 Tax=Cryptomeria japonica TaxID=3369 RepID=UPI002414A8D8|nr:uncharacterized protein LOC131076074 [Cryptomeria japonica]GLJ50938.1 hypothetical protein SUGI_1084840 [Cryptomeria japonica]